MEWQPIADAPKKGERVLVVHAGNVIQIARNVNGYDHWMVDEGYTVWPTHFLPLPAPPSAP